MAYIGKWAHGFFATVAVGATNVGTIKVHFDEVKEKAQFFVGDKLNNFAVRKCVVCFVLTAVAHQCVS